jgi:hypothetical protein
MRNPYGSMIEDWKVEMVAERARRMGFRRDEIDDVLQQIVPVLMRFRPTGANGAGERTAFGTVIERRLTSLRRGRMYGERRLREYRGNHVEADFLDLDQMDHERRFGLGEWVRTAVAGLPSVEQAVCGALAAGRSQEAVAAQMGITRYALANMIKEIRGRLAAQGIDACALG